MPRSESCAEAISFENGKVRETCVIWNSFAFISLVCSLLSTASAVLSFSAKRRGVSLLSGSMYSVLAVWSFALFLCLSSATSSDALLWSRAANYVVLFLPAIVFHFVVVFVGQRSALERIIVLYYILSLVYFSIILLAPDSFLHSPSLRFDEFWFPIGGSLFYLLLGTH